MVKLAIRFISEMCLGELMRMDRGEITLEEFDTFIDTVARYGFTEQQPAFFKSVKQLARQPINQWNY